MTVYVDNARIPARVGRITGRWSHLTADTRDELHAFATRLGLRPGWFQTCQRSTACRPPERCVHWHYDVTASKRAEALAAGATPIDIRDWAGITRARRAAASYLAAYVAKSTAPIPAYGEDPSGVDRR